jgi:adenylate kinase
MARLLIVGPPGAGKGSQAARLAGILAVPAISTGDIFRDHVRNKTPLGLQVESIMKTGEYVPDSLTNDLVRDRLSQEDCGGGFLLDGYPRTAQQVDELDAILEASGDSLDAVVHLHAEVDELVARLSHRAVEQGRVDDTPEVIRHRIDVYQRATAPLLEIYRERGLLCSIDGLGAIPDVTQSILQGLSTRLA